MEYIEQSPQAKPMYFKNCKQQKGGKPLFKTGNSSEHKLVTAKVHKTPVTTP